MNESIFRISLDIHNNGSQALIKLNQNDTARTLTFVLTEDGKPYKLTSDVSASLNAIKPDGTQLINACTVDPELGLITYNVTAQTTSSVGEFDAQLMVTGTSGIISSPKFTFQIRDIIVNDIDLDSTDEFTALVEMYNGFNDYTERIQNLENSANNIDPIITAFNNGELKGEQGEQGVQGVKGDTGATGVGIASIVKTSTDGLVDNYTITLTDGSTKGFSVRNGADGAKGDRGDNGVSVTGAALSGDNLIITLSNRDVVDVGSVRGYKGDKGDRGEKGNTGDPFQIYKTYPSVDVMYANAGEVPEGKMVLIVSNVSDPDNAKLYVRTNFGYSYITDLSGADGIKGDKGETGTGIRSIEFGYKRGLVDTYLVNLTDGTVKTFDVTNAEGVVGAHFEDEHLMIEMASGKKIDAGTPETISIAVQAKNDAVSAKTTAVQAKNDAESARNSAQASASASQSSAEQSQGYANEAKDSAEESERIAESIRGDLGKINSNTKRIENLEYLTETEDHLVNDTGIANELTVPSNTAPNNMMNVLGANPQKVDLTSRAIVKGKTERWNQLRENYEVTKTERGLTYTNNNNKSISVHGVLTLQYQYNQTMVTDDIKFIRDGRKYLIAVNKNLPFRWGVSGYVTGASGQQTSYIYSVSTGGTWTGSIFMEMSTGDSIDIDDLSVYVIDMSSIFGAGNEPTAISDPRIQEIIAYAKSHPEYDEGSLKSVELNEVTYCGENLCDNSIMLENTGLYEGRNTGLTGYKTTDYIFCYGANKISVNYGQAYAFYDANKNVVYYENKSATVERHYDVPVGAFYFRTSHNTATYSGNIVVNFGDTLVSEPYNGQTLPFSTPVTLNGLDTKDELYSYVEETDGQKYLVTKKIERWKKMVLNGSENWQTSINDRFYITANDCKKVTSYLNDIVCDKLSTQSTYGSMIDLDYSVSAYVDQANAYPNQNWIYVFLESSTTKVQLIDWLSTNQPTIVYPLATPTITEISRIPLTMDFEQTENILADAETEVQKGVVKAPMVEKVESVGANIWNEITVAFGTTGIRSNDFSVIENTQYYIAIDNKDLVVEIYFKDINGNNISTLTTRSNSSFNTPTNCRKMLFVVDKYGTTYNHDIAIIKGTTGTYSPYFHHIMLASQLTAIESKLNSLGTSLKYGDLDLDGKKFVKTYGKMDLGSIDYVEGHEENRFYSTAISNVVKKPSNNDTIADIICSAFNALSLSSILSKNKGIAVSSGGAISISDVGYESFNSTQFKQSVTGLSLVYELATQTPIDLSDILTDDDVWLPTEPNGTVTFVNADNLPIKYDLDWLKKGATV